MRPGPGHIRISDLPPQKKNTCTQSPFFPFSIICFFFPLSWCPKNILLPNRKQAPSRQTTDDGWGLGESHQIVHTSLAPSSSHPPLPRYIHTTRPSTPVGPLPPSQRPLAPWALALSHQTPPFCCCIIPILLSIQDRPWREGVVLLVVQSRQSINQS